MTDKKPVEVVPDNNPETPEDTTVVARFNRKKVVKALGVATGVVAGLALYGAAMKRRGKEEFIEDVRTANGDDADESAAS